MRSQLLAAAGALCIGSLAVPAGATPLVDTGVKAIATETSQWTAWRTADAGGGMVSSLPLRSSLLS